MSQPARAVRKFNPGTGQSDEELVRQFVVREKELEIVLDVLRSNIDASCCQNTLVVAPRGAGKTMLLARVAAELRSNDAFSQHLLPVRFMEESFEAYDIGEFWLEAMFHLALEIERSAPDVATELRQSHQDLSARWRPDLATQALATLLDAADQLDRRLVLLVENLADLCGDVDDDFGWALRGALQTEPRLMLLSSATTRFQELDDVSQPFFELFRFVNLKPLDSAACVRLWNAVSGHRASEKAIRPLEIFTGGSPRLLVMVAEFAGHRSLPQLMDELVVLMDNHTEYFRGHLERLPKGERRVYVATIDLWQPSSTSEIAQRARMDVRTTSTCIGRLVNRGMVSMRGSGVRKRYVATERLYCIYYKLRRERDETSVVRNLIRFMTAFYMHDELMVMFDDFTKSAKDHSTIAEVLESGVLPALAEDLKERRYGDVLRDCDRFLSVESPAETACRLLRMKAACLHETGDHEGVIATCNELLERYRDQATPSLRESIVTALLRRGVARRRLGDVHGAVRAYREVVRAYDEYGGLEATEPLALAYYNMAVGLRELDDVPGAVDTYDKLVTGLVDASDPATRSWVAQGMVDSGVLMCRDMGESARAKDTYNDLIARFDNVSAPDVRRQVALAIVYRGIAEHRMGEPRSAMASWNEVIERFSQDMPETREVVARAMHHRAIEFALTGRANDAYKELNRIVDEFGGDAGEDVRAVVGRALATRAAVEIEIGRPEEALHTSATLGRDFAMLSGERFVWQAACLESRAYFAMGDLANGGRRLRAACRAFGPNDESIRELGVLVHESLASGFPIQDLIHALSSDVNDPGRLAPLLVALRQKAGKDVRAPDEVLDVAADIRAWWDSGATWPATKSPPAADGRTDACVSKAHRAGRGVRGLGGRRTACVDSSTSGTID